MNGSYVPPIAIFIGLKRNNSTGENTFFKKLTSQKTQRRIVKHVDRSFVDEATMV